MDDSQGRRIIDVHEVTVEYDFYNGKDAVLFVPFPHGKPEDSVILVGGIEGVRSILMDIHNLISSIENED